MAAKTTRQIASRTMMRIAPSYSYRAGCGEALPATAIPPCQVLYLPAVGEPTQFRHGNRSETMSHSHDVKKQGKKKPLMTAKEKKQAKQAKKHGKDVVPLITTPKA